MNKNKFLTAIACIVLLIVIIAIVMVKTGRFGNSLSIKNSKIVNPKKEVSNKDEKIDYVEEITVYNAAEYMNLSTIKDFEKEFKIKVNYKEFDSNETMYNDIRKYLLSKKKLKTYRADYPSYFLDAEDTENQKRYFRNKMNLFHSS